MNTARIAAIVLRQFYLMRGSPARVLPIFIWVTVDMVLWGFLSRYLNSMAGTAYNFVPALLGAVLLWDFFGRVMHGVVIAFLEDVWTRNFLNVFSAPLSIAEYVAGLVISSIGTSLLALAAMLLLAGIAFGLTVAIYGTLAIPFLLVLFLFGISLGLVGCALVLRYGPAAEWFLWPIPAIVSPFAGVFYPVSTLPAWMQMIARVVPPSYAFEGLRALVAGRAVDSATLLKAIALALVYLALAGWLFVRVYRHAVRTGLLARYSAESVS